MDYNFLLIKIQKHSSMITRSAHLLTKTSPFLIKQIPSLLFTPRQPYSKLSEQLRSATYRQYQIKFSNPRFQDSNTALLTYFTHPYIETKPDFAQKCYQVKETSVLTLNFLNQTAEEFVKQAWENRKIVKLRFREVMRLLKVEPLSNQVFTIHQKEPAGGMQEKDYRKELTVADKSEREEVEIFLRQVAVCPHTRQEDTLWETKIDIKYEDYTVFQQSIRSNMLYTSGAKFNIEITKQQSFLQIDGQVQSLMKESKQTSKKTATKGTAKTTKKYKVY